uniref:Uncharacterized protein n=1 Tax=viral metagenome TaxID=1070528 RepID=A0A6H1ZU35_9ZZZZ
MKQKILNAEEVNSSTGKTYKKVELSDGTQVSCWPDFSQYAQVISGAEVEGIIFTKGKYKNLVDEKKSSGGFKTSAIKEAQSRKEASIAAAQDRTQTMWAKNNACTLVAHHPVFKDLNEGQVKSKIIDLTNAILNMDLQPF